VIGDVQQSSVRRKGGSLAYLMRRCYVISRQDWMTQTLKQVWGTIGEAGGKAATAARPELPHRLSKGKDYLRVMVWKTGIPLRKNRMAWGSPLGNVARIF